MTRINLVPPSELCDQHLLAEHRELTRIPNAVARGKYSLIGQPLDYKLGEGHVKFFYDKLFFLFCRYNKLHEECHKRNFYPAYRWFFYRLDEQGTNSLWKDYIPTEQALAANRARIAERMPKFPRYYSMSMVK